MSSRAAVSGMTERSVRLSQPSVIGTPSTSTATCRDSMPRSCGWASPREFSRMSIRGMRRSTSSSVGEAGADSESSRALTALAPPAVATGRVT